MQPSRAASISKGWCQSVIITCVARGRRGEGGREGGGWVCLCCCRHGVVKIQWRFICTCRTFCVSVNETRLVLGPGQEGGALSPICPVARDHGSFCVTGRWVRFLLYTGTFCVMERRARLVTLWLGRQTPAWFFSAVAVPVYARVCVVFRTCSFWLSAAVSPPPPPPPPRRHPRATPVLRSS